MIKKTKNNINLKIKIKIFFSKILFKHTKQIYSPHPQGKLATSRKRREGKEQILLPTISDVGPAFYFYFSFGNFY
jgi:hypothetical protein